MKTRIKLTSGAVAVAVALAVVAAFASPDAIAQKRLDKSSPLISGYAHVGSLSTTGHVSVGLPMAERIVGPSVSGWIGFYPVKRVVQTSVEDIENASTPPRPNPASSKVVIPDIVEGALIMLVDAKGASVSASTVFTINGLELDVSALPNGSYSVAATSGKQTTIHRFVVAR